MGGEEHDAGVEGPAELGHRGCTFLNDPTPGSAAEFAQEEGSLRLGKPIADDVARVGDPGSYRLVDNVDVLEVGSPGRSAHGGRGAQLTVDGLEELVPLRWFPSRRGQNTVYRCLRRWRIRLRRTTGRISRQRSVVHLRRTRPPP